MANPKLFQMPFSKIYGLYQQKITKKQRSPDDLDAIIMWLTGYNPTELGRQLAEPVTLKEFFDQAPTINPNVALITGTICGVRIETIADPLMQRIRYLDKLVDELAKGRPLGKILRH